MKGIQVQTMAAAVEEMGEEVSAAAKRRRGSLSTWTGVRLGAGTPARAFAAGKRYECKTASQPGENRNASRDARQPEQLREKGCIQPTEGGGVKDEGGEEQK